MDLAVRRRAYAERLRTIAGLRSDERTSSGLRDESSRLRSIRSWQAARKRTSQTWARWTSSRATAPT